jgi:hypothetical protein
MGCSFHRVRLAGDLKYENYCGEDVGKKDKKKAGWPRLIIG